MNVILIPGFWLNESSWGPIAQSLSADGHQVRALTLPGMSLPDDDRSAIGLRDHVQAVIDAIDEMSGSVILVGHSGGGAIAHAAADARPDRVARVIYVDAIPLGEGGCINDELPVVNGEIPLPDWSVFSPEDLIDLDEELRVQFRARAIPEPAAVASDLQVLGDVRRYDVPATVIACEFSSSQLRNWISEGHSWISELAAIKRVSYIDLPTGHWPHFTRPEALSAAIASALSQSS